MWRADIGKGESRSVGVRPFTLALPAPVTDKGGFSRQG
jgi:hypothetical protein